MNYYRTDPRFTGQPDALTFFSGDVFNPSIESTVTKGRHMVPFLNKIGTDVACVGVSQPNRLDWKLDEGRLGDYLLTPVRITIWILELPNFATWLANAIFHGYWPMF